MGANKEILKPQKRFNVFWFYSFLLRQANESQIHNTVLKTFFFGAKGP